MFFLRGGSSSLKCIEIKSSQALVPSFAFSNSVGSQKMFKIWKSDMFFRCRLLALLFDLHNLEHMIRGQNAWNSNSWTNYSIFQTPILRSIMPFLFGAWSFCTHLTNLFKYFSRTFHSSLRDNVKGGCRFFQFIITCGGWGPSTSLHKWAQGLGPKPDPQTYGKKVFVKIE